MHKIIALLAIFLPAVASALTIADNNKSPYTIIVANDAPAVTKTAASELQQYLHDSTGVTLPIADHADGPKIYVGSAPQTTTDLGTDGIIIKTTGDDLYLTGGQPRGTINAVTTFLQDYVGIRWWTSHETFIPHHDKLEIPDLDITYVPKFMSRHPFYTDLNGNTEFAVHSRCDGVSPPIPPSSGGNVEIIGMVHTFAKWLPPEKYFKDHPDWYALVNGKRVPNTQLCTTNPQMRDELLKVCLKEIDKNPNARIISISQNDTFGPCQCDRCQAIAKREGTEAGPMIDLCNDLADRINKVHKGYTVHTLAYQYTRHPTKTLHASPHVLVQLCSIECDFSKPLRASVNDSFGNDLRGWAKMAPNLCIWNYTTNFANYLIPQPNFFTQGDDLRFFSENHVVGVFQEGDYQNTLAGDFLPMRTWVLAQLLWNPQLDQSKVTDEFLNGYYGAAGPFLRQYLDLVNAPATHPKFKIPCYNNSTSFYSKADIEKMNQCFDAAEKAVASDAQLLHRVRRERLVLEHVNLLRYDFGSYDPQTLATFKAKVAQFAKDAEAAGVRWFSEGKSFNDYVPELLKRADHKDNASKLAAKHVAVDPGKKVWGFNYDRNDESKLLEENWFTHWDDIEGDFAEMHQLGANTVRIHIQVNAFLDSPTTGNQKNLDQLKKLLDLAQKNNLKIDLTGLACYRKESVPQWFTDLPEQDRWNAQAKFWEVVAQATANHPALFCYDLINEASVPGEKHTSKDDWLAGHLADFWFCQRLVLDPGKRDRKTIAHAWTTKMIAAIRKYDDKTPITAGMLPWPNAYPLDAVKDDLDFIAVHVYPSAKKVDESLKTIKQFQVGKPVLIEETFPMACSMDEEKQFILQSRPMTMGVISFYWGKMPAELRAKKNASIGDLITADWLDLFQQIAPGKQAN